MNPYNRNNQRASRTRVFTILTVLPICGLLSCSQPSSTDQVSTAVPTFKNGGAMKAQSDDDKKDKKLTIKNKSSHDVTLDVTFSNGDDDTYSCSKNNVTDYATSSTVSALSLSGTSISSGSTGTTVTLTDGSMITVTWDGNVVVVVDTLEMN